MDSHEPIETTEKLFSRIRSREYQQWIRLGIHLAIIGVFAFLLQTHRLDRFENIVLDAFIKQSKFQAVHPAIALIRISQEDLHEIGAWPWPRSYHAIMLRLLDTWRAAAVILDIDFSELTEPKEDQDFVQALEKIKTPVYLPLDLQPPREKKFWIHGMPVVLNPSGGAMVWTHPLPEIEKRVKATGHHHLAADPDGVLRRFDPFLKDGKSQHPFLALSAAYDFLKSNLPPSSDWTPFEDSQKKVMIPWLSPLAETFPQYHYADLIHSFYAIEKGQKPVIDPAKIAGRICIVGFTAENKAEFKTTPMDLSCPALNVIAQIANSALTGQWIRPAPFFLNLLCLLAIGLTASFLFLVLRSATSLLVGLLLGIGWFCFCFAAFDQMHFWFFSVYPFLLILCLFIFSAIYVQMAGAKEKTHLFHLATRDGLTGLYVIRHFRVIMNQVVREASVKKEPLSIMLLDVDDFKKINDTFGHPAGDMVLKKIAGIIFGYVRKKRAFRDIDFAARYGGEEFIVMFRNASLKEASLLAAERIRRMVEGEVFEWEGKRFPVTISAGVSTLHSGENVPDPMVHRADAALYQAKRTGKNRVCSESA